MTSKRPWLLSGDVISPFFSSDGSLNILGLFPEFLQFGLARDNHGGDGGVLDLGSDGVDLATDLLHKKVNLASSGLGRGSREKLAQVAQMRVQPDQLFGHVELLRQKGNLLSQPPGIDAERAGRDRGQPFFQPPSRAGG